MSSDNNYYKCWTANYNQDAARQWFEEHYGKPPQKVFILSGLLWVGPVPPKGENNAR